MRRFIAVAGMLLAVLAAPPAIAVSASTPKIFFITGSDMLTADMLNRLEIVAEKYREIVEAERRLHQFTVHITGYTDRTGSTAFNQRLSEQRAKRVAGALVRFGVARGDMMVSGRGENDNIVPTAPGVAEPFNRRVDIWLE